MLLGAPASTRRRQPRRYGSEAVTTSTNPDATARPVLRLAGIGATIDGVEVLAGVDWTVHRSEQWVVLGPNGGGKSTLVAVAGLHRHPSAGTVEVLDHELGRIDIRPLRRRIGTSSAVLATQLRSALTARDVVMCGSTGALEPWWHTYSDGDRDRASALLVVAGLDGFDDHTFGSLSSGERQRCLLARALMPAPELLLLDEPTAGLDFAGREALVAALVSVAARSDAPATALVTHHLEDIPPTTTHLLAIGRPAGAADRGPGRTLASGPIDEVLTEELLGELFGLPVELGRHGRRWSARART